MHLDAGVQKLKMGRYREREREKKGGVHRTRGLHGDACTRGVGSLKVISCFLGFFEKNNIFLRSTRGTGGIAE